MSRQSERFLIGQSRKFLLTAARLKDGTNRDEPGGAGLVGLAEACARWKDDTAGSSGADESQRALSAEAIEAHEARRRPGCGAWITGKTVQSQAPGRVAKTGAGD